MKKLLVLFIVLANISILEAQTFTKNTVGSRDFYALRSWSAFTADSSASYWSNTFDLSDYDSVDIWAMGVSANGTAKFSAILEGGFLNIDTRATSVFYASLGTAADTTNIKLETIKWIGRLATLGATVGRIKVTGSSVPVPNRKDTIVDFFISGFHRMYVPR